MAKSCTDIEDACFNASLNCSSYEIKLYATEHSKETQRELISILRAWMKDLCFYQGSATKEEIAEFLYRWKQEQRRSRFCEVEEMIAVMERYAQVEQKKAYGIHIDPIKLNPEWRARMTAMKEVFASKKYTKAPT